MTDRKIGDVFKAAFTCKPPMSPARITGVVVLSLFTLGFASAGCLMWFSDYYVDSILNAMTLRPDSSVFEAWRKPPVKPLICVFIFNYTNFEEYANKEHPKIILKETGPYCYRETLEKINITFNDDGTITYGDTRKHQFEPENSGGGMNDTLIVPNLALIGTMGVAKSWDYLSQISLNFALGRMKYTNTMMKVKAHDFLFGYDDNLISLATDIAKVLKPFTGVHIPFDKFGLLSRRAAITSETITVATGTDDLERIGMVTKVDGEESLDVWPEDECNRIDGSDGAFFPRHGVNESATIYLFHRDLCRRMPFIFDREAEFQDGIMGMRFHAAPDVYNTNGTCYCVTEECAPMGVFDLSPCSMGAPIMMSFPHFLYGDPVLFEEFEGLSPEKEKHEFFFDVNRLLGFTLGTVSRLQLNLRVKKPAISSLLREFPDDLILPVVWIQVSADRLPPDLYNLIYHATVTVQRIQLGLRWGTLSLTLLSASLVWYLIARRPHSTTSTINNLKNKNIEVMQEMIPKSPATPITVVKLYPTVVNSTS